MGTFSDGVFDVIVVGGGPAGCVSAAAAARHGASVLLIEAGFSLGGMGTAGLVNCFAPFSDGEKLCYGGIAYEVLKKARSAVYGEAADKLDWVSTDPETLKRIYDDLVTGSGAKVLFGTMFCDAEADRDGRVTDILCCNKSGLKRYRARVFIDCTGDADVAYRLGVPCEKGGADGNLQPASLCFMLAGVDTEKLRHINLSWGNPGAPIHKIASCGDYPAVADHYMLTPEILAPGVISFNAGHIYDSDGSDPEKVSLGMIRGRQLAFQLTEGLRRFEPSVFGKCSLVETAPMLGIRETRRIKGEYVLTFDDYNKRRSFADGIARNCYTIDIHTAINLTEWVKDAEGRSTADAGYVPYKKGESHGIPYRSLLPVSTVNLLVAGRSISCDRAVNSSIRVMPCCMATAQAAGTAAAMAARSDGNVRGIDIGALRAALTDDNCII